MLVFDNRGIGGSDTPPGPYTARAMAEDAVAVLDAAGVERAHVLGTSLGGMVAQELVLGWPRARPTASCSPARRPAVPSVHPMPEATVRLITEAIALPRESASAVFVENALSPPYDADWSSGSPAPAGGGAAARGLAGAGCRRDAASTRSTRLGEIAAPTLVVTGTADEVVDPRNSDLLAAAIPDARLERFEGCGHLFFWQEPERFVRLVAEFLDMMPAHHRPLDPRPGPADARPRRDRLPGAAGDVRRARGARPTSSPRSLRPRRPDRDPDRQHARARRSASSPARRRVRS